MSTSSTQQPATSNQATSTQIQDVERNLHVPPKALTFQDECQAVYDNAPIQYDPNLEIHFLEAPEFEDIDAAALFDENIFKDNPGWKGFLRRCAPVELPNGQYEEACKPDNEVFLLVLLNRSGKCRRGPVPLSKGTNPEEYAASVLSKEPH